jgi:hypothetical protein
MKRMNSKYAGKCGECGQRFPAGTLIDYDRNAPKGLKAFHADCNDASAGTAEAPYGEFGSTEWNNRPTHEIRTSEGTYYQRAGGRCEDAPCCGCCTF